MRRAMSFGHCHAACISGSMMIAHGFGLSISAGASVRAPVSSGFKKQYATAWILERRAARGAPAEPAPTTTTSQCSSVSIPNLPRFLSCGPPT